MTNGYVLVDCKGLNLLVNTKQTIAGIFESCKAAIATGKPVYAVNCVYGAGVAMTPIQVFAIEESGNYIFTASILQITVEDDNGVTVTSLIS